jgi:CRP-like cAMP-binding protein
LQPGYRFCEIALLSGGARTATVTVVEPANVYALERAPFLAALTGSLHAGRAADELMAFHLDDRRAEGAATVPGAGAASANAYQKRG